MFSAPFYCGLLPDQSFLLNRRADSGLMPHRIDLVLRSPSNVSGKAKAEPIYEDVSSLGGDDDGGRKKISRFGSKCYEGEVKVTKKMERPKQHCGYADPSDLFRPPTASFGSTGARRCGTRTRRRWEKC